MIKETSHPSRLKVQLVTFWLMSQRASFGPSLVWMQAIVPSAKSSPAKRQVQSACAAAA